MLTGMSTSTVLCMDAGQSGIRTQVRMGERILAEFETGGVLTDRPLNPQLARAATEALQASAAGAQGVPHAAAIGTTGLNDQADVAGLLDLLAPLGITEVFLAHDSITSYLGALGDEPGVVVAAGTGVVTLAVGEQRVQRVDGWGYLIGDAGSGFWIGRAGLDAVMRAHDGRGPATALTEVAHDEFGDLEQAYLVLQADPLRVSRIARYARVVAELATDDPVCRRICQDAAAELAHSVITGLQAVGQDGRSDPAVAMIGKAFHGEMMRATFEALILERFADARLSRGEGNGLGGAFRLTRVDAGSALTQRIRYAGTTG